MLGPALKTIFLLAHPYEKAALQRRTPQRGRDSCARRGHARCVSHNLPCTCRLKKAAPEFSRSGAAGFIATKLLLTWRWRLFWLSLLPTFRRPLSLAGRRCASLLLLWRLRLSLRALHSFSWDARFTR